MATKGPAPGFVGHGSPKGWHGFGIWENRIPNPEFTLESTLATDWNLCLSHLRQSYFFHKPTGDTPAPEGGRVRKRMPSDFDVREVKEIGASADLVRGIVCKKLPRKIVLVMLHFQSALVADSLMAT